MVLINLERGREMGTGNYKKCEINWRGVTPGFFER